MTANPAPPPSNLPLVDGAEEDQLGESHAPGQPPDGEPPLPAEEPERAPAPLPSGSALASPTVPPAVRRKIRSKRLILVLIILFGFIAGVAFVLASFFRSARQLVPSTPPVAPAGPPAAPAPPAGLRDTDGDGLTDADELALGTNPAQADTDGDGYTDAQELQAGYDPQGPGKLDGDRDGLADADEGLLGTDPRNADTDGDGYFDGKEVAYCHDPRQPSPNDAVAGCPPYPGL